MRKTTSGFTIVELLIVIVVIAILAAISIVAYTGIQTRAESTKTINAVEAYKKAVMQYGIDKGGYPNGGWCLGDQYLIITGATYGCRDTTSPISNATNASIRDTFKPYLGNQLPMASTKILYNSGGTGFVGGMFYGMDYNYTLNGSRVVAIYYYIEEATCPVGPAYAAAGWPTFTGNPVSRTSTISANASACLILLPANP